MEIKLFTMARHWMTQVYIDGHHRFTSRSHPASDNEGLDAHARGRALAEAEAYIENTSSQQGDSE